MEKESDISLGGALNLHTLVALTIFVGEKSFWVDPSAQSVIL